MIFVVLAAAIVVAVLVGLGYVMWREVGWAEVFFVYGFTAAALAAAAVIAVLSMQGSYEMGWCTAGECRVW